LGIGEESPDYWDVCAPVSDELIVALFSDLRIRPNYIPGMKITIAVQAFILVGTIFVTFTFHYGRAADGHTAPI
jgi:hypothetical protein